jgi:hypothetical protein
MKVIGTHPFIFIACTGKNLSLPLYKLHWYISYTFCSKLICFVDEKLWKIITDILLQSGPVNDIITLELFSIKFWPTLCKVVPVHNMVIWGNGGKVQLFLNLVTVFTIGGPDPVWTCRRILLPRIKLQYVRQPVYYIHDNDWPIPAQHYAALKNKIVLK